MIEEAKILAVAKALCEADGHDWETVHKDHWNNRISQIKYENMAYKAIKALEEVENED